MSRDVNWDDLAAFRAVAEELNFTRAAERLHLSQPGLSQRIRRLERSLRRKLLERTTRSVRLTPAGQMLLTWVKQSEEGWEALLRRMPGDDTDGRTRRFPPVVRIGGAPRIDGTLTQLRLAYPETRWTPRIFPLGGAELLAALQAKEIDVAVWEQLPYQAPPPDAGLQVVQVLRQEVWVYLSSSHPLAGRDVVDLAQLAGETWIATPSPDSRAVTTRICQEIGGFDPRYGHISDDDALTDVLIRDGYAADLGSAVGRRLPGVVRLPFRNAPSSTYLAAIRAGTDPSLLHAAVQARLVVAAELIMTEAPDYWSRILDDPRQHSELLAAWTRHTSPPTGRTAVGPVHRR